MLAGRLREIKENATGRGDKERGKMVDEDIFREDNAENAMERTAAKTVKSGTGTGQHSTI